MDKTLYPWLGLVGWIILCFAAPAVSASIPPGSWYAGINKPTWNPPGWIFGPVWTFLYVTMAIAAWRVWLKGGFREQRKALGLFLLQLALNAAWTPIFFGAHWLGVAFAEILLLWLAILLTLLAFQKVDKLAAGLLVPYLAWVSFASVLNFTLWRLNA